MTIREDAAALRVPWVRPARPGELDGLPVEELWLRNRPAREATELRAPLGLFMRRWMTVAETRDPWAVMELAADQRLSPWAVERAAAATVLRRTLDDAGQLARGASSTRRRVATRSLGLLQQPPSGLTHRVAREDAQTSI